MFHRVPIQTCILSADEANKMVVQTTLSLTFTQFPYIRSANKAKMKMKVEATVSVIQIKYKPFVSIPTSRTGYGI